MGVGTHSASTSPAPLKKRVQTTVDLGLDMIVHIRIKSLPKGSLPRLTGTIEDQ